MGDWAFEEEEAVVVDGGFAGVEMDECGYVFAGFVVDELDG